MNKIKNIYNTDTAFDYNPDNGKIYYNGNLLSSAFNEFNQIFQDNYTTLNNIKSNIDKLKNSQISIDNKYQPIKEK